jgi:hypothetical protein
VLRSYPDHVREVESIYHEVIARKRGEPIPAPEAARIHVRSDAGRAVEARVSR